MNNISKTVQLVSNRVRLNPQKTYVGKDLEGNMYFEILPQKYCLNLRKTTTDQEVRMVQRLGQPKAIESKEMKGQLTKEWDAWLKKIRKDPPKLEELMRNIKNKPGSGGQGLSHLKPSSKMESSQRSNNKSTNPIKGAFQKEARYEDRWSTEKK